MARVTSTGDLDPYPDPGALPGERPVTAAAGRTRAWAVLLVLLAGLSVAFSRAGLPSPVLFGALAAGLIYALSASAVPAVPAFAFTTGQAILGVSIGALFDPDTLTALRHDWAAVIGVCVATLALSVLAGFVLRLHAAVDSATGVFAMVAGGASGIVAIARELGADDRIVAVVQYLRVLVIILVMPLVAQLIFTLGPRTLGAEIFEPETEPGLAANLLFTVVCVVAGLALARWIRVPAASLLLPLTVAVLISVTGVLGAIAVPAGVLNVGYALIGLQVGLRFTRASLKAVATVLPLAIATILGLIAASAALGVLLAEATGRSRLDGYLATTPGGLYAVLATAVDRGSDVTFILTVQIVRLFVMLFSAPLLARWLRRTS
jgi:membrane AbrB-like protein